MEQTELVVINTLLKVIGESPVNTKDLGHPDIVVALDIWDEYSSEIQSNGWWYNTETWQMTLETDNTVKLPVTAITIIGDNPYYIKRGRYLYDLENHTTDLSGADSDDLEFDIVMEWSIEDIPPVMFSYILAVCKFRILMDLAFDQHKAAELKEEIQKRFFLVQKQHLKFSKPNRLNTVAAQAMLTVQPTR